MLLSCYHLRTPVRVVYCLFVLCLFHLSQSNAARPSACVAEELSFSSYLWSCLGGPYGFDEGGVCGGGLGRFEIQEV